MNILLIGTTDKMGGAAKISQDIKTELEKQGHKVSMFVADKKSNDSGIKIIPRIKWRKILGFLLSSEDFIKTNWILNTKEFKDADLIHCHNLHGRFFNLNTLHKMSLIKPVVWTLHDEWAITPHCACTFEQTRTKNGLFVCPSLDTPPGILWDNTRYLSWKKNSLYEKSKLNIVTPSKWLKERVIQTILKNQNITLIPNGINTNLFSKKSKDESRKKLGLPMDKKIILFLADNAIDSPWKGWKYTEEVIRRFEKDKDVIFLSVGNHSPILSTENIRYIGHISDPVDVANYYNSADILLFTSVSENFPLVILEAMSCGLPIVSFDVGGVKEVLEHKINGFIAKYKDTDSLIEGIDYIISLSNDEVIKISNNSSLKIKDNYSCDKMTHSYIELYNKLI